MTTVSTLIKNNRHHNSSLVSVDGHTYPLKSANLSARAEGGIAGTTLTQTYENPYVEALEVLYTLPLPADGAVIGYTIRFGKRVIRGEVRKREEAREEYRKALLEGRTAALLEQERADTFSQRLGSLPPGETAIVEIEMLQPLAFLPGTKSEPAYWEYRFPTVAGVRYEGDENRVPDAEVLDVDRTVETIPVRLEVTLVIADGAAYPIRPYAPDQRLDVREDGNGTRVVLEKGMPLNRDLVIRWTAGKQETGVRIVEGKGLSCDNGRYLLITLTPPNVLSSAISRDLTLLIDSSGSMAGQPLDQAKTVAIEMLRSLDPGDRFEILAFSSDVRRLISGPADAGERNIDLALKELRKLGAAGSTEMTKALIEALKPLRPGSQRQVVLLSDGYIGFEKEAIGEIWRRLVPGARVHVVGVGSAPNRTLTRGAARAGRGVEIIIGLEEDARKAAAQILQSTVQPVLTDIMIEGFGLVSHAPQKPRDVFAGQPALIFAEVKPEGGQLQISGKTAASSSPWVHVMDIPPLRETSRGEKIGSTSIPVGALFGREALEDAEIELSASTDQTDRIKRRIESLGLRHGISSRMTSLIAISEDTTVDPRDPRRRERLPVEVPAGVSAEGAGLMPRSVMPGAIAAAPAQFPVMSNVEPPALSRRLGEELGDLLLSLRPRAARPAGPTMIARARVLRLDDQTLIFDFEVPVDGFALPDRITDVNVTFEDGGKSFATVVETESSKPGPYQKGLTVRLALKLEGHARWQHNTATIQWHTPARRMKRMIDANVEIRVQLKEGQPRI